MDDTLGYPLVAEPGEGFAHGPGIDWAGRLVEVLAGVSLEECLQTHILALLGATTGSITFFPDRKTPRLAQKRAVLSVRDELTGRAAPAPPGAADVDPAEVEHCMGGWGLFADMGTYFRVLESLLADDETLLGTSIPGSWMGRWVDAWAG